MSKRVEEDAKKWVDKAVHFYNASRKKSLWQNTQILMDRLFKMKCNAIPKGVLSGRK